MYLSLFYVVGEGLLCLGSKRKREGRGGRRGKKYEEKRKRGDLKERREGAGSSLPPEGVLNLSLVRGVPPGP